MKQLFISYTAFGNFVINVHFRATCLEDFDKGDIYSNYLHHDDDDVPAVEQLNYGTVLAQYYYRNNKKHSYKYPAYWYYNGSVGDKTEIYWINGNKFRASEYLPWIEQMGMDLNNLSEEDRILIDLKWTM